MRLRIVTACLAALLAASVQAEEPMQWVRSDATLEARMRQLWDAQVTWTRLYVVSALGDLPDTANARARLFGSPTDFEAAIGPYYGRQKAQDFSAALSLHLQTLVAVLHATTERDTQTLVALRPRWRTDAETTAAALGRINPAWSTPAFLNRLDELARLTDREVSLRARGDFKSDITTFDEAHERALELGELMARDILGQFPPRPKSEGR
jgi:hypothetical protein